MVNHHIYGVRYDSKSRTQAITIVVSKFRVCESDSNTMNLIYIAISYISPRDLVCSSILI